MKKMNEIRVRVALLRGYSDNAGRDKRRKSLFLILEGGDFYQKVPLRALGFSTMKSPEQIARLPCEEVLAMIRGQ